MVVTELHHVGATSKCRIFCELWLLVGGKVRTISICIKVRPLNVELAQAATEPTSVSDLLADHFMLTIVDEIVAPSLRSISEANSCHHSIEARTACCIGVEAATRHAEEASSRTRHTHLLSDGGVVAMFGQVFARRMLLEASLRKNIEASMFRCNVLADSCERLTTHLEERGPGFGPGISLYDLERHLVIMIVNLLTRHIQNDAILNQLLRL